MTKAELMKFFHDIGIVPVVKIDDAEKAVPLAKAMIRGGLPACKGNDQRRPSCCGNHIPHRSSRGSHKESDKGMLRNGCRSRYCDQS